jgi:putative oxidoreductase
VAARIVCKRKPQDPSREREPGSMHNIKSYLPLLGRVLLSAIFIVDGILQLIDPGGTARYFAKVHVPIPSFAIWISVGIHLLGGLAILLGFRTRWAASMLALFCLGTAFGVHLPAGDMANMIHFLKNLAMAGGFTYVIAFGAGDISVDGRTA